MAYHEPMLQQPNRLDGKLKLRKFIYGLLVGLVFFGALGLWSTYSKADEVYNIVVKKQAEKVNTRWSLSDWLDTKEKFRLQDMWLAMHSPSPYEFFLGYDYISPQSGAAVTSYKISLAAYASIVGLEGRYQPQPFTDAEALFKLRFFGYHVQATHISLTAGIRNRTDSHGVYNNSVIGADSALYFNKYFGGLGEYQYYMQSASRSDGTTVSGQRWDVGAFIDFSFFRVTASWFTEGSTDNPNLQAGYAIGGKIFF